MVLLARLCDSSLFQGLSPLVCIIALTHHRFEQLHYPSSLRLRLLAWTITRSYPSGDRVGLQCYPRFLPLFLSQAYAIVPYEPKLTATGFAWLTSCEAGTVRRFIPFRTFRCTIYDAMPPNCIGAFNVRAGCSTSVFIIYHIGDAFVKPLGDFFQKLEDGTGFEPASDRVATGCLEPLGDPSMSFDRLYGAPPWMILRSVYTSSGRRRKTYQNGQRCRARTGPRWVTAKCACLLHQPLTKLERAMRLELTT